MKTVNKSVAERYNYNINEFIKATFPRSLSKPQLDWTVLYDYTPVETLGTVEIQPHEMRKIMEFCYDAYLKRIEMDLRIIRDLYNRRDEPYREYYEAGEFRSGTGQEGYDNYVKYKVLKDPFLIFYALITECITALELHRAGLLGYYNDSIAYSPTRNRSSLDFDPTEPGLAGFDAKFSYTKAEPSVDSVNLSKAQEMTLFNRSACRFFLYFRLDYSTFKELKDFLHDQLRLAFRQDDAEPVDQLCEKATEAMLFFRPSHYAFVKEGLLRKSWSLKYRTVVVDTDALLAKKWTLEV